MKTLSVKKLAKTVRSLRESKGFSKEDLGNLTGISSNFIGRIERKNFTPTIIQLESLSNVLGFEPTEMFVEKERTNCFVDLRSEALSDSEKEGVEKLYTMMLALRQQINLRKYR